MFVISKINDRMGSEFTAHAMILFSNFVWSFGLMLGAETYYASTYYIAFTRGICTVVSCYLIAKYYGHSLDFRSSHDLKIILQRCVITSVQQVITSYGFKYLQPSIVYTIANIGPIIVFVMDYVKNNTTVTSRQQAGIAISCMGLIITVNSLIIMSWLGYDNYVDESKYHYEESSLAFKVFVCVILFVEYVFWAWAMILTKDLKKTNSIQLNYVGGLFLVILSPVFYLTFPNSEVISFPQLLKDILSIGFLLSFSTLMYMASLQLSKNTGSLTITNFSTVIIGYIISIVRYGSLLTSLVSRDLCVYLLDYFWF